MRGCLGRVVALVLLAGVGYSAWRWGPEYAPVVKEWWENRGGEIAEARPTEALAESAMARLEDFRSGESGGTVGFDDLEVLSVLLYARPNVIPDRVLDPSLKLEADRVIVSGRLATASIEDLPSFMRQIPFLPDTLDIEMEASLIPVDARGGALVFHRIQASEIPIPESFHGEVVRALGAVSPEGVPDGALWVPYPAGIGSAYLLGDSLVLVRQEP